ncbi:MAG: NAD(P)H-binding protein [Betaproteobacteria bacterium]|nr:NAD(P)H-binding protein [Betaproteobacteria bacterium]
MKRLLVIGCGDVARRALPTWLARYRVSALLRAPDAKLASAGVQVIRGDLDRPETLAALASSADLVAHLAPPGESGARDQRTRNLVASLGAGAMLPQRIVYVSTSGVYGDCAGERIDESRATNPQTERAIRRVDAETVLREWGRKHGLPVLVLRAPGIYAAERLPLELLRRGTPVLRAAEDSYTNHIHADDFAAIVSEALERGAPGAYNASDDGEMKMGDWFDLVADRCGLPRAARVSRAEAQKLIPPGLLSFMNESRRLLNGRMKEELGLQLRYPTVFEGVPRRVGTGD